MTQPLLLDRPHSQSLSRTVFEPAIALILKIQHVDGRIPWFEDGIWDAWNHVECAMALEVFGQTAASDAAYDFLRRTQKADGSWLGDYGNTADMVDTLYMSRETKGRFHDTNFIAYCATGIWHRYVTRGDKRDLREYWPMVSKALGFVLEHQSNHGDIAWSSEAKLFGPDDSVLAGNASIRKSLESGLRIAVALGKMQSAAKYQNALWLLDKAISQRPDRFDRNGDDRSMFAMDWYYPAMSGSLKGHAATLHIRRYWHQYVDDRLGCHCVTTDPWITVAESAELAIALAGLGAHDISKTMIELQLQHRDEDGTFWMGYQYEEELFWPREKPSWTQAAMVLAAESLRRGSPTQQVLCQHS